ncbi:NAD(P)H nitroreductase [Pseudomonas sp. OA65]|uniref:NAD(P)H nitroreductase n=1 Tax=Pseudomonas sp. OA65 TaxID=2818431 RepID=UPI001A9DE59A|nr:NAD(P)H nitroreductase [Pseudomonas sp. OA65]MBO1540392.1 NAD(P)H nitroreductase [Pseudomonas sp. OA65]
MQALDALLNRVSVPRLVEPAPTPEQRELMFAAAMRAPDHGQLRPWRFLTVEGQARQRMGELLAEAAKFNDPLVPEAVVEKALNGPLRAPLVVVVIARLQDHFKIPKSEQLLAAGCAAHGILLAAYAQGIGGVWRTGELAYSPHVARGLGLEDGEEVIGFLYLGTPQKEARTAPKEDIGQFVREWTGPQV